MKGLMLLWILDGFLSLFPLQNAEAQCVRIRDRRRNNAWTFTPKKDFKCLANNQSPITTFTITFESPVSNVNINWGDTIATYDGPLTTVSRTYKDTGTFAYTITEDNCPTPITGYFVNNYNKTCPGVGWIAPPNDSTRCLPATIALTNFSPRQNGFTEWIINWGDNKRDTADYPSYGKTFAHVYKAGSKICNAIISIVYKNSCNVIPCGQALSGVFGPYRFMERDSAIVSPSSVLICSPTAVTINDISKLNCLDTANRFVSWTALDGFGQPLPNPGNDIWRPRGPAKNKTITIPADMFSVVPPDSIFKIRMRIQNKCGKDTAETIVRLIPSVAPKFSILSQNGCAGSAIPFANNSIVPFGTVRYVWNFGDGKIDSSFTTNVNHIYTNSGTYTVKLKARTIGYNNQICDREISDTVHVRPAVLPKIFSSIDKGCDSLIVTLKNRSIFTNNVKWQGWEFGGTPSISGDTNYFPGPLSSDPGIVKVLTTNPADSSAQVIFRKYGAYIIKLKGTTSGCDLNTGLDTITVLPRPKLRFRLSSTKLCQGETFFLYDSSRVMETLPRGLPSNFNNITWSVKVGNDTTINSAFPITGNFDSRRTTALKFKSNGTFWIKFTVSAGGGCPTADSIQVIVKPSAIPKLAISRANCASSEIILKNTTVENANKYIFKIYKGNGLLIGQQLLEYVKTNKTDQPIFLSYVPPGDSSYYFVTITAVTYTGNDSCVATSSPKVIKVGPTPVAGINISPLDGCTPLNNVSVQNTSFNLPFDGSATFSWKLGSLGTFSGNTPPPLTFTNDGNTNKRDTIKLCINTINGCSYCKEAVVLTYPAPKGIISAPDSICSGDEINISASAVGAVSYNWEFTDYDGSSSTLTSLSKVFNNATGVPQFYTIRLILRSAADCPSIFEKTLKVNPKPEFEFQSTTSQDANCGLLRSKFYYLNSDNAVSYKWKFGPSDSLITTVLDTIYKNFGNETSAQIQLPITLTATSNRGCKTIKQNFLAVNPLVKARFKVSADSGCAPMALTLTDSSTLASNVRRWLINGMALQSQSDILNYVLNNPLLQDTVYTIQLAVRNDIGFNCVDTATKKIKVFSKPRSNDLIVSPASGCSPLLVTFTGYAENAIQYLWNFGDGVDSLTSSQVISHSFFNFSPTANQVFNVTRIASSVKGCTDTTTRQVTAKPRTEAIISALTTSGCSPLSVQFSAANSVNYSSVEWNFDDNTVNSSSVNPLHVFTNNSDSIQILRVRFVARKIQTNSCPDTSYINITVNPAPVAGFSMSNSIGCGPLPVIFTDLSVGGSSSYWTLNAGGISTILLPDTGGLADTLIDNPNFISKNIQVIQTVTSAEGCTSTKTQNIQIFPNLTAEFNFDTSGCHPHLVKFLNTSENFLGSYSWNFGDGSSSSEKNPLHLYENFSDKDTVYNVTLTSISPVGNCEKIRTSKVKVYASPRADFGFQSDSSIQLPVNSITIRNKTRFLGAWTYKWTFDDGSGIFTGNDPVFTHQFPLGNDYFTDTNFVISLVAISPRGCTDTLKKTMVILPGKPVAAFEVTPKIICAGNQVQFTNLSSFSSESEWTYQDTEGSPNITIKGGNPVVYFGSPGRKTIKLKVKGLGGRDSITKYDYVFVYAKPSSYFETIPLNKEVVAPEEDAIFIEIPPCDDSLGCTYRWDFGDGTGDTLFDNQPVRHRYQGPGKYKISLLVTNSLGCTSVLNQDSIRAVAARDIAVPNGFIPLNTPGGCPIDNFKRLPNCIFYPLTSGMVGMNMQIFNRWGQLLFENNELGKGWDGFYLGKALPGGTYIYRIVADFSNGDKQTLTGDVTLIR